MWSKWAQLVLVVVAVMVVIASSDAQDASEVPGSAQQASAGNEALERTRKQVRMLDDIYKGGIVLITTHYVTEESDMPAGTAFKALFQAAKKKGWHEVRLLDATGTPYNEDNTAKTEFEKSAVKSLKAGKTWYEEIETVDGKRYLHAATPIPVVMDKCVMCHDNYADAKKGQAIGALGYRIPIE